MADEPASLYAPKDLMLRATEILFDCGMIIYDALFLALAEDASELRDDLRMWIRRSWVRAPSVTPSFAG